MTERLKEVNRALIEDPTPAECDRAITVRFREVIADYQSPREYIPSDSDDGYGDSSDLLYDAEDEEGLTALTSEVKEVLGGNVNVVDLMADLSQESCFVECNSLGLSLDAASQANLDKGKQTISVSEEDKLKYNDNSQDERKTDVPKLRLDCHQDESQLRFPANDLILEKQTGSTSQVPSEKTLLKVDESGLADLETFINQNDTSEILECLPGDAANLVDEDEGSGVTMSLIEVREEVHIERGPSSLNDVVNADLRLNECDVGETNSNDFFQRRESGEVTDLANHLKAINDADIAYFENSDEFEDSQDEELTEAESKEEESSTLTDSSQALPADSSQVLPADSSQALPAPSQIQSKHLPEVSSKKQPDDCRSESRTTSPEVTTVKKSTHKSRKDQSVRKSSGTTSEKSKKRTESNSPSLPPKLVTPPRSKPKHVATSPPMIKPALLSSEKLNTSRHRTRTSTSSRSRSAASTSSSSSSPLSSASSSSSYSSSLSSHSSPCLRGRSRTPISGPVRPTAHRSAGTGTAVRLPTGAHEGLALIPIAPPVRSPTSAHGLALTPTNPAPRGRVGPLASGRTPPHAKVRKAASASDLHKSTENTDERQKQNNEVFRAWLRQKNKQAAVSKKQYHASNGAGKSTSEVTERRKRAEEAFQAWLSRKREQLRLEKKMRGERRRLEDQTRYARSKAECETAYKEWCRRKREEVRTTVRVGGGVPRSQSLERPWAQEKTRKLYTAYLSGH
ncbi:hypothetical protein OTU49_015675 [Cherax quadricarinatus]|uniref:Coiled-coil domain-containing protein 181 n=3 Tax=Cherax quadricarinatus TaxID=27406 RepID=A0AAW0YAU7_CHEQU